MRPLMMACIVFGALGLVQTIAAQEMPPPRPGTASADPAECQIEPRSLEAFIRPHATPSATIYDPRNIIAEPPRPLPAGEPADAWTMKGIEAAL